MKNCISFFIRCSFILCWIFFVTYSGKISGQEKEPLPFTSPATEGLRYSDSIPIKDSILLVLPDSLPNLNDSIPALVIPAVEDTSAVEFGRRRASLLSDIAEPTDSIVSTADSIPKITVIGLADPLDTLSNRIYAYQVLDKNSYARLQVPIDTTMARFNINNPVMRNHPVGAYLGNAGLSFYPVGFEARKRPSDFLFTDNVSIYLHMPEETKYYQTQMPYTLVDYSSAGSKIQNESILSLVHTQNVNQRLNVGLSYDILSSIGQYQNQNAADNAFTLFSAYRGAQYSIHANFNWNNIRMRENGGLIDSEFFNSSPDNPADYSVRSTAGKTVMINRSLYFMQSYSFKQLNLWQRNDQPKDSVIVSRFTLVHTFKYEWSKREYSDTATYLNRRPYFGTTATHDSLYFRRVFNHFELMLKEQARNKFTAGFSVGILTEIDRYNNNIIPDTTIIDHEIYTPPGIGWGGDLPPVFRKDEIIHYRETEKYFNTALTGRFFNHTGRYLNWDFNGRLYFTGYKIGDLNINGTVQLHYYTDKGKNSLLLGGSIENAKPSYFLSNYSSNLLSWDNDFNASQEVRLRGEFVMPHRQFKIGVYLSQLNNYVYINSNAVPAQASDLLVTGTAFIEKDIKWWKLGFRFKLYGQYSSHEKIVPLPALAGYQSTYFQTWLVPKVLNMQIGWDINYNTRYYAYAYAPSSGMFYVQDEHRIGNYPFFDLFLNFQINRARIFVKTEGLNTMLTSLGKEYYMVYRYPLNEFRMKFGVSWAFYD